jgi:hypothetical protein
VYTVNFSSASQISSCKISSSYPAAGALQWAEESVPHQRQDGGTARVLMTLCAGNAVACWRGTCRNPRRLIRISGGLRGTMRLGPPLPGSGIGLFIAVGTPLCDRCHPFSCCWAGCGSPGGWAGRGATAALRPVQQHAAFVRGGRPGRYQPGPGTPATGRLVRTQNHPPGP